MKPKCFPGRLWCESATASCKLFTFLETMYAVSIARLLTTVGLSCTASTFQRNRWWAMALVAENRKPRSGVFGGLTFWEKLCCFLNTVSQEEVGLTHSPLSVPHSQICMRYLFPGMVVGNQLMRASPSSWSKAVVVPLPIRGPLGAFWPACNYCPRKARFLFGVQGRFGGRKWLCEGNNHAA